MKKLLLATFFSLLSCAVVLALWREHLYYRRTFPLGRP